MIYYGSTEISVVISRRIFSSIKYKKFQKLKNRNSTALSCCKKNWSRSQLNTRAFSGVKKVSTPQYI